MTSSLLGISITGLRVSQSALSTTGNNIANAGVDGYSRQRVQAATNPSTLQGAGFVGNGVNVESIDRIADEFVSSQLRIDTSLFNDLDIYHSNIEQLDSLLADVSTGLSAALESFFDSVQNGADDPTSIPSRQLILSEAENLSDRFNTLHSRFETINDGVDTSLRSSAAQINALSQNIAELNQKISEAIGQGNGAAPNDLLDQRDQALKELSEQVGIQTFSQGFGQINVVIAGGQNLVVGNESRELILQTSNQDPSKLDVVFQGGTDDIDLTNLITGGQLGGLLRFQNSILDTTYNELGRIAIVMADTFNELHQEGLTLNNEFGGDFFYDVNNLEVARNRVISNSGNAQPQDRVLSLNIADSSQLSVSDYQISVDAGGLFRIERLDDEVEVATGLLTGAYPQSVSFDGLELVFEDGSFQAGDTFQVQPTRSGARDFSSVLVNATDIAFASPIVTDASLGNTGTGQISSGEILSLVDQNGETLPLFATPGEFSPPLSIVFTSDNTYDVMDVSDPSNPVHLDPPLRNQLYVVGADEPIFTSDPGERVVTTQGQLVGLPSGATAVTTASLNNLSVATVPSFAVTDFSAPADQFSFDVTVSNTLGGGNDGTVTININNPAIIDENSLLSVINSQLTGTDVTAYLNDGALAFRLDTIGYGDLVIDGYTGGVAGQADALLGFAIESTAVPGTEFTTVDNVNGVSGNGSLSNGYPAEVISFTRASTVAGESDTVENVFTDLHASARETASLLSNQAGVSANAFNFIELSNPQLTRSLPLQINLNGEDLLDYEVDNLTGQLVLTADTPDPQLDPHAFNVHLAEQINSVDTFSSSGIYAVASTDEVTGLPELHIFASQGDDLHIALTANENERLDISDGINENIALVGAGENVTSEVIVGGRIDVTLADGVSLSTFPPNSLLFGDTNAADFAKSSYLGIQASIIGVPKTGDTFSLNFNNNATSDNRNALAMSDLQIDRVMNGGTSSFSDSYSSLVEAIGIDTNATSINRDASEQVLEQTIEMRDSISGVNLDEEASNLLKFEQMYSANAQVISVARDLFDRLINSF